MRRALFLLFFTSLFYVGQAQENHAGDKRISDITKPYIEAGQYEKALVLIDSALAVQPDYFYALEQKGAIYANYLNQPDKALEYYLKALEQRPNYAILLANIGKNYYALSNSTEGKAYLEKALQSNPMNPYIIGHYARNAVTDLSQKVQLYERAIFLNKLQEKLGYASYEGVYSFVYNNLGYNLYLLGEFERSAIYLLEGLNYDSDDPEILNNLGNSLLRLSLYYEGIEAYDRALKVAPNKIYSLNGKANAYLKLKQIDSACVYWKKAIDNGYVFRQEWAKPYDIQDPVALIQQYCEED